jgi:hypothetical protein
LRGRRLKSYKPIVESGPDHGREYEAVQVAKKAKNDLIASMTAHVNSLLADINSLLKTPPTTVPSPVVTETSTASHDTQTDLTSAEIDRQNEQVGRLRKAADMLSGSNQQIIAQLQAENTELRNQLDVNTRHAVDLGLTVAEYNNYIEFRERIIDLLTRAQTGYDYRLLNVIFGHGLHKDLQYAQREYTIAGIASNNVRAYSTGDITLGDWREANSLVIQCIGLLKGIGVSVNKADMPRVTYDIECLIRRIRQLLPVKDTTVRPKNRGSGHLNKGPRVLVGRSIDKALEAIQAFRRRVEGEEIQIPEDPFEVAVEKGVAAGRLDEPNGNIVQVTPNQPILRRADSEDARFTPETLVSPGLLREQLSGQR